MSENRTQFDYLLNAYDLAAREDKPAEHGYAEKRRALFAYVRELEEGWTASRQKALQEAEAWQPIATAPKCRILAIVDGAVRVVAWGKTSHLPWQGYCLADQGAENFDLCEPTHWKPYPQVTVELRTLGGTSKDGEHG